MSHCLTKIRIHPFFILSIIFFYFSKKLTTFAVFYLCAFLHEFFHFLACIVLNEKPIKFTFYPYGVNMKTNFVKNPVSMMIISACGPLSNLVLYLISYEKYQLFASANLIILILNSLPILPLDGGIFLKSFITLFLGYVSSHKILLKITKVEAIVVTLAGIFLIIITKYNISLLIIGTFLLYNIRNEKMNLISLRKKLICNEFLPSTNVFSEKMLGIFENTNIIKCIDCFSYNKLICVSVYSHDCILIGTLSQGEIISALIALGVYATGGDALRFISEDKRKKERNFYELQRKNR